MSLCSSKLPFPNPLFIYLSPTISYVTDNSISDTDINSAAANVGAAMLVGFIQDTKTMLQGMGLSILVGNSDAGSYFNNMVLEACDFGVRPYLSSPIPRLFYYAICLTNDCSFFTCA